MSAETVLYTTLSGAAAVVALTSTRIYPDLVPQESALPCVAFQRVSTEPVMTIHSATPIAEEVTLEVACMSTSRVAADALADAVRDAAGAAGFSQLDRRAELDPENSLWATILTVEYLSQ